MIDFKVQEQKHEPHHCDWPMFLSVEQRQKLLQGKLQRALKGSSVANSIGNSHVKLNHKGHTWQNQSN